MIISKVIPKNDFTLQIITEDNKTGTFDVSPYLQYEAFEELKNQNSFMNIMNGGYFVEWDCGADLSADTISAHLVMTEA
jgi:hypothetical protein